MAHPPLGKLVRSFPPTAQRLLLSIGTVIGVFDLFVGASVALGDTAGYTGSGVANNAYPAGGLAFITDTQIAPGSAPAGSNGGEYCAAIDTAAGYALFGSIKGDITKVKLGGGPAAPTVVGITSSLNDGYAASSHFTNMVMDTRSSDLSQRYAYIGGSIASLLKVQMYPGGNPQAAPKVAAILTLPIPSSITQGAIDLVNGSAYFVTFSSGTLVRLSLDDNSFTSVTGLPANLNYWQLRLVNNILYISDPTQITRIRLGANGALPAALNASNLDSIPTSSVVTFYADADPAHPSAYTATFTVDPTHLSTSVSATFTRFNIGPGTMSQGASAALSIPNSVNPATSFYVSLGELDPDSHYLLMATDNALPGSVSKIAGEAGGGPAQVGSVILPQYNAKQPWPYSDGDLNVRSFVIDPTAGYAYMSTDTGVANTIGNRVIKVQYSQKGSIKGNRISLPAGATLTNVNLFANAAAAQNAAYSSGNMRLAIYADSAGSPGALLWQSGDLNVKNVPIGGAWIAATDGALTSLAIGGGNYWLAWQLDSTCDVPAFAGTGAVGTAFTFNQPYGAFASLAGVSTTSTTDAWQISAAYTPATAVVAFRKANGLAADGSQDTATPAADGVANLSKFAFNMLGSGAGQAVALAIPNTSAAGPSAIAGMPVAGSDASGRLIVTSIRRKASAVPPSGITYHFEFNNDLSANGWAVNPSATEATASIDANFEQVIVTDSVTHPAQRFGRVKITVP